MRGRFGPESRKIYAMMRGCAAALLVLAVLAWARPVLAQTEVGPFGSCKKGFSIRMSTEPLFAVDDKSKVVGTLLRGAPRNPVTIECDDTRHEPIVRWPAAIRERYASDEIDAGASIP